MWRDIGTEFSCRAACVSLSTATHLVGLVGPYKQPYRKTLSLNRARYIFVVPLSNWDIQYNTIQCNASLFEMKRKKLIEIIEV